jgi:hypothetical protein
MRQSSQDDLCGRRLPLDRRCVHIALQVITDRLKSSECPIGGIASEDTISGSSYLNTQHSMYTPPSIQLLPLRQFNRLILTTYAFQEPKSRLFFSFLAHGLMSVGLWDRAPLRLGQFGTRSRSRRNNLVLCQRLAPRGGVAAVWQLTSRP